MQSRSILSRISNSLNLNRHPDLGLTHPKHITLTVLQNAGLLPNALKICENIPTEAARQFALEILAEYPYFHIKGSEIYL